MTKTVNVHEAETLSRLSEEAVDGEDFEPLTEEELAAWDSHPATGIRSIARWRPRRSSRVPAW
jgi:hypothetical protein